MHKFYVVYWHGVKALQCASQYSFVLRRFREKLSHEYRWQRQLLDTALGIILWHALLETEFFAFIYSALALMISRLEVLIEWLTKCPAGLKLNAPLNRTLSQFFAYHIYLWQTYLSVTSVWIGFGFLHVSCLFGISVFFAALSDLVGILTVHILCFNIYASRLEKLCETSIRSLWRVFRGRKYNPLRSRVDSVHLDSRELFIATLFFTILLFLLPTVIVYFLVFSLLRYVVIAAQYVLSQLCSLQDRIITLLL